MRYRVLAPLTLHSGLLGLTPEQAQARSFGIVAEGALWRVLKPIGFKAGEVIEHHGSIPKAMAHAVAPAAQTANEANQAPERAAANAALAAPLRVVRRKA